MAAALSRALKLPGKKGSELGEYDPLTQADSEDESEEDDLVLNYPRNGLGRDEEDEWREGGPGALGGAGLGVHSTDEEKRMRVKNAVRSAFFLVPLVCATLVVLLCAFLIPCQKGELEKRPLWERALGDAEDVTPPALALWDVDGDSVEDVFLGDTEWTNDTHGKKGNKIYSVVALSAVSGQVLWRKVMQETVMYIQCGLQYSTQPSPVCLLIGKSFITTVSAPTGQTQSYSSCADSNIESQAVLLPDLQGDSDPDLLVATLPADEVLNLEVILTVVLQKLVPSCVPSGNVKAISLQDIYFRASGKMPITQTLRRKDPGWEGLKKDNFSSVIQIYRWASVTEFLLPLVDGYGNNHNSLDSASNLNSSRSDWVLVYGNSTLSLLRQRDLRKEWTFKTSPIHSQPAAGYFNNDGILDLFIQHSSNVQRLTCSMKLSFRFTETSAISTSAGQSTFLFWASEPIKAQRNVSPVVAAAQPLIRKLFLLHPTYPTVLLELSSTTDTAVTSAVSYQEHQKDATYITVSSRPTPNSQPSARIVKSMSLRAAITKGQIVRLGEGSKTGGPLKPGAFEVSKFFRRLTFRHQVRKRGYAHNPDS
uniref:Family with sequence similarity 234 member B n=1 Tax=Amphilophus citrinellus TaxID=61819 RepID=A0A3Q0T4Z2_AMPCI